MALGPPGAAAPHTCHLTETGLQLRPTEDAGPQFLSRRMAWPPCPRAARWGGATSDYDQSGAMRPCGSFSDRNGFDRALPRATESADATAAGTKPATPSASPWTARARTTVPSSFASGIPWNRVLRLQLRAVGRHGSAVLKEPAFFLFQAAPRGVLRFFSGKVYKFRCREEEYTLIKH